ncbi:DUF2784 domain-containing protein [Aliiglaciecola sp. M165]|uniref:DUF2784 domain-containing protein n=1 Tax=Aliiglaciecola sp. M165 TaxID=2593649 RepID=UPI00117D968E|nr:DUF2784 domain-containing protein [Aliiglaciecola sp. M165]TRY31774.1 DUF2784 domain-containing protein [Aliiglaciecola sp. M165]
MAKETVYLVLADSILIVHTLFVAFVVVGLVLIYMGYWLIWPWVKNFWFRLGHLTAITFVVVSTWLGNDCPLTVWEMALREAAGESVYQTSFIQYWLHQILYYTAPDWVFVAIYTAFGALVLASWFLIPPNPLRK